VKHDNSHFRAGLDRAEGINYILNCFPELARKLNLNSSNDLSIVTRFDLRSLSKSDSKVVAWMKLLFTCESIDLSDHLKCVLKVEYGFDREHQKTCLIAFAIWSGWGSLEKMGHNVKH
jgi:hypothetical protein